MRGQELCVFDIAVYLRHLRPASSMDGMRQSKGVIDWSLLEVEFYFPEDGILLLNRSRTSVFSLPNYIFGVMYFFSVLQRKYL